MALSVPPTPGRRGREQVGPPPGWYAPTGRRAAAVQVEAPAARPRGAAAGADLSGGSKYLTGEVGSGPRAGPVFWRYAASRLATPPAAGRQPPAASRNPLRLPASGGEFDWGGTSVKGRAYPGGPGRTTCRRGGSIAAAGATSGRGAPPHGEAGVVGSSSGERRSSAEGQPAPPSGPWADPPWRRRPGKNQRQARRDSTEERVQLEEGMLELTAE
ncbi:uncharacterized protein LOC110988135 [Acanthaster planci]|uniref:Uncharacterized protein LOC110988135 n=1 Tax=Acanthaster planci TaxID=133434 RepID=A0A8B7ZUB4_ACAPL|nr:uncharacterized protein LOC110988135 [Acanthaster planci]